jgi:hypothetical protein
MSRTLDELRQFLALAPEDSLELGVEKALPPSEIAHGLQATASLDDIAGTWMDLPFLNLGDVPSEDATIQRCDTATDLFIVANARAKQIRVLGRSRFIDKTTVIVDAGGDGAYAQLLLDQGEVVFELHPDRIRRIKPHREPTALISSLANIVAPVVVEIPEPSVSRILDGRECEPWLRELATVLARSVDSVDRAAAVGALARLWSPEPQDVEVELAKLRAGAQSIGDQMHAWATNLSAEMLDALERSALLESDALAAQIANLQHLDDLPFEIANAAALAIAYRRDDIESVCDVLTEARCGQDLRLLLASIDHEATLQLSVFSNYSALQDDPRLRAIFRSQPDAWWGNLAG